MVTVRRNAKKLFLWRIHPLWSLLLVCALFSVGLIFLTTFQVNENHRLELLTSSTPPTRTIITSSSAASSSNKRNTRNPSAKLSPMEIEEVVDTWNRHSKSVVKDTKPKSPPPPSPSKDEEKEEDEVEQEEEEEQDREEEEERMEKEQEHEQEDQEEEEQDQEEEEEEEEDEQVKESDDDGENANHKNTDNNNDDGGDDDHTNTSPDPEKEEDHHHHDHHHEETNKKEKATVDRPPLNQLIKDSERGVKGDISFLLDWAILGHAKAGTTFIKNWVSRHPDVSTWEDEVCDLYDNKPAGLAKRLYEELDPNKSRGFKCPGHFSRRSMRHFHKYYRNTKLIVGVRHPIRWFESFYNFRMRHAAANYSLPHPNELNGECTPEKDGVCTERANFQTNLAVFGKTPMTSKHERNLIRFTKYTYESTFEISNPIFLYDVDQFAEGTKQFAIDLQDYLELDTPLPEPTKKDAGMSSRPKPKAMNICLDEFIPLRKELIEIGTRASDWILDYFLESPQVYVSQEEQFRRIVQNWKKDPCDKVRTAKE